MNLLLALLLAVGRSGGRAVGPSPVLVYVANQASGKVTVIDAATDSIVATVDFTTLGFSAHPKPHHIVVEPDGSYWYVSLVGDNAVVKLDRSHERSVVRDALDVGGQCPGAHRRDQPRDDDAGRSRSAGASTARSRRRARWQARLRRQPGRKPDRGLRCQA